MLRAIREIKPVWIVGENVPGIISWNRGMVFNEVQTDLEAEGYEVQPVLLPACGVNAPHKRERVWFVAHAKSFSRRNGTRNDKCKTQEIQKKRLNEFINVTNPESSEQKSTLRTRSRGERFTNSNSQCVTTDTGNARLQGDKRHSENEREDTERRKGTSGTISELYRSSGFEQFPTQSPICGGNDGIPRELDGITFSKWRNESIKGFGNAIVPQVAYEIFKVIDLLESKK